MAKANRRNKCFQSSQKMLEIQIYKKEKKSRDFKNNTFPSLSLPL